MITVENWKENAEYRIAARQFFASQAGQAFLQMLFRARQTQSFPPAAQQATPEQKLGMLEGWDSCLRFMEGLAMAEEKQMGNVEATFQAEEGEEE